MANQNREKPYFIESDDLLERWEDDRYLIDRRKILTLLLKSEKVINLNELYLASEVSIVSFSKALVELKNKKIVIQKDKFTLELLENAKKIILANSKFYFSPSLSRSWNTIPTSMLYRDKEIK
ncbi:hypothetical protein LG202_09910 [Methylobacillus methanolivorans]